MIVALVLSSITSATLALPALPANANCRQRFEIRATDVPAVFPQVVQITGNQVRVHFKLMDQNMKPFPTSPPRPFEDSFVFVVLDNTSPMMIDVSDYPNPWTFDITFGNLSNGRHDVSVGLKMQQYPRIGVCFRPAFPLRPGRPSVISNPLIKPDPANRTSPFGPMS